MAGNLGTINAIIGADTSKLSAGLNDAKGKLASFGSSVKNMIADFAGSGGLSLAIAGATLALTELANAFIDGSVAEQIAKQSLSDFNNELAKTGGELAKETEMLNGLVNIAQDESQSRQTRTNALKELQREYPGYLNNISLEKINTDAAKKAIDELTAALQRKLKVQAITNLIQQTQENILKTQNKDLIEQTGLWDKIVAAYSGVNASSELLSRGAANQSETINALQTQYDKYVKMLQEVQLEQSKAGDFQGLKPPPKEKIDQVAEALRKFRNEMQLIDQFSQGDILKDLRDKLQATEGIIRHLIDLKVPKDSSVIGGLSQQATQLTDQLLVVKKHLEDLKNFKPEVAGTPAALNAPIFMDDEALKRTQERIEAIRKGFNTDTEDKWWKKLQKDSQSLLHVYEGIADAMSNIFASIFKDGKISIEGIGDALMNLIAQLAQAAIRAAILAALLSAVGFGVGPGGGLIKGLNGSFGSIFGNLLGGGAGLFGHAEGGIFTGPTMFGNHVFGEAGPEALIPLDRLNSMMNDMNGPQAVNVRGRVELGYNTLAIAFDRTSQYRARNYGNRSSS